ncbi:MAG: hypothetical protein ACXAD7_27205, partial [Candidatus Kariarchaeaceae archaeon]
QGTYTDTENSTDVTTYTGSMQFETNLDPNITAGVWSFQFRWFNETAGGAIAVEFEVLPQTVVELITPSTEHDVLEGDIVSIEVATLDLSHNRNWTEPGNVTWAFDDQPLTYDSYNAGSNRYHFTGEINTSISKYAITPGTYEVNVSFSVGSHTDFVLFNMNVFFRAGSQISQIADVDYGSSFNFTFTPINFTNGGSKLYNSTPSEITWQLNSQHTMTYNPATAEFNFTLAWNSTWNVGLRQIELNWTFTGYRNITSLGYILMTIDFNVINSDPVFTNWPLITTYEEDSPQNYLNWTVTDDNPKNYTVFKNDSYYYTDSVWESGKSINISIVGEILGTSNFTIIVEDEFKNQNSHKITITVVDTKKPQIINEPSDFSYEYGQSRDINWEATDKNHNMYEVLRNNTYRTGSTWDDLDPFSYTISDALAPGVYNFTIVFNDTSGNILIDEVIVTITDSVDPNLSPLNDFSYAEGSIGNNITWAAFDDYPYIYNITMNDTTYLGNKNQVWNVPSSQFIDIDGLALGVYSFIITYYDTSGNIISDEVIVTVYDDTDPVFTDWPGNLTFTENSTDRILIWNAQDNHYDNYTVYQDGSLFDEGNWTSSDDIIVNINILPRGSYSITIVIQDTSGNLLSNTTIITINDVLIPTLITDPGDTFRYFRDDIDNFLSWKANDSHPDKYILYKDGEIYSQDDWDNVNDISVNVDGLAIGEYNFTIVIFDDSNNFVLDTVTLTVKDPLLIETVTPDFFITNDLFEGDVETIEVSWNTLLNGSIVPDATVIITLEVVNSTYYAVGEIIEHSSFITFHEDIYDLVLNYTSLLPGEYNWTFEFTKEGYESAEKLYIPFIIHPHNYIITIDTAKDELVQGEEFDIFAEVSFANP